MNNKFDNRRKFQRVNFDGQLDLEFINKGYSNCHVANISLTGLFILGDFEQRLNEFCDINLIHNTEAEKMQIRASGKVMWCNDKGVGLKLASMSFDSYLSWLIFLATGVEEPVTILNEFPKLCPFTISDK